MAANCKAACACLPKRLPGFSLVFSLLFFFSCTVGAARVACDALWDSSRGRGVD